MKTRTALPIVLLILLLTGQSVQAQYIDRSKTTVFVGMALPRTNLTDYAEQGINIGIKEVIPLRKHLGLTLSAEMFRNRIAPAVHSPELQQGFAYTDMAKMYNIPVFAHLNFGLQVDRHSNFRLWTEGAMGVNFRLVSIENGIFSQTFSTDAGNVNYKGGFTTAYDMPKVSLATQWGIGVTLFRRYSIAYVRYNLGRRSLTGSTILSNPVYLYDDGSNAPSAGLPAMDTLTEFDLGKVRSRYHVVRFGLTF